MLPPSTYTLNTEYDTQEERSNGDGVWDLGAGAACPTLCRPTVRWNRVMRGQVIDQFALSGYENGILSRNRLVQYLRIDASHPTLPISSSTGLERTPRPHTLQVAGSLRSYDLFQ